MPSPEQNENNTVKSVTVYAASSHIVDQKFKDVAFQLGKAIAEQGWIQLNGGWHHGLMGASTQGAISVGGIVDCVTLEKFLTDSFPKQHFRNVYITKDMRDRKTGLYKHSQAFISLPGGVGTLDELAEVLCLRQLMFHTYPIVLLNVDGYYNHLRDWFLHAVQLKFVDQHFYSTIGIVDTVEQAIQFVKDFKPVPVNKDALHGTGTELEAKYINDTAQS